eukprot:Colp12_sorted_trinity150504_noHs@17801
MIDCQYTQRFMEMQNEGFDVDEQFLDGFLEQFGAAGTPHLEQNAFSSPQPHQNAYHQQHVQSNMQQHMQQHEAAQPKTQEFVNAFNSEFMKLSRAPNGVFASMSNNWDSGRSSGHTVPYNTPHVTPLMGGLTGMALRDDSEFLLNPPALSPDAAPVVPVNNTSMGGSYTRSKSVDGLSKTRQSPLKFAPVTAATLMGLNQGPTTAASLMGLQTNQNSSTSQSLHNELQRRRSLHALSKSSTMLSNEYAESSLMSPQLTPQLNPQLGGPVSMKMMSGMQSVGSSGMQQQSQDMNMQQHMTPQLTPQMTPHMTPTMTPQLTPHMTPQMTPQLTPHITPQMNPQMTPQLNPQMTPRMTPQMTPQLGPQMTPQLGPHMTPHLGPTPPTPQMVAYAVMSPLIGPTSARMDPPAIKSEDSAKALKPKGASVSPSVLESKSNYEQMLSGQGQDLGFAPELVKSVEIRRNTHKVSEKKRRDDLKCGFMELRSLIPQSSDADSKVPESKASILKRTIQYLQFVNKQRGAMFSEMQRLREENERLRAGVQATGQGEERANVLKEKDALLCNMQQSVTMETDARSRTSTMESVVSEGSDD